MQVLHCPLYCLDVTFVNSHVDSNQAALGVVGGHGAFAVGP